MSSLSQAGRSIMTNEINRAFTKGLYGVDPSQLERKQQQKRAYQQQLRKQAEQAKQRKADQKQKLKEQDERLQRKIQMDIQREKQEKEKALKQSKQAANIDSNNIQGNSPNIVSNKRNNQFVSQRRDFSSQSSQNIVPKSSINNQQMNIYRKGQSSMGNPFIGQLSQQEPVYPIETRNIYNYEEQRFFQQEIENRARRFKQTLDRKLEEVYLQIESSKKAQVGESVVDQIRRKLKSNSYLPQLEDLVDLQKSGLNQFQEQFSQFYKIPKKQGNMGFEPNDRTIRNLDYESESKFSSRIGNYPQQSNYESRVSTQRKSRGQSGARWRLSGRKNDITRREALDLKLDATLANIGDIINNQNRMYGQ